MDKKRLNFSVGPVMMQKEICSIGGRQIPYFRTAEFSGLMNENEALLKQLTKAEDAGRVVFLTGSGTAGMEAAVMNAFTQDDKVLVINGGSFGSRFQRICEVHGISYEPIYLKPGESLTETELLKFDGKGFTGLLINMHETSTGVLYDMEMVSRFCKKNNLFLIVDAISSFMADEVLMEAWGTDILILASQKALALPPGMSFLVLSKAAVKRVQDVDVRSIYFNLKDYLKDGERGQTPYTPAVSILIQLNARLQMAAEKGIDKEIERVRHLAQYFRKGISGLPFELLSSSPSNAVTALVLRNINAQYIFEKLDKKHEIWICPNGGDLKEKVFRVGHIGNLKEEDYDRLIKALWDVLEEVK